MEIAANREYAEELSKNMPGCSLENDVSHAFLSRHEFIRDSQGRILEERSPFNVISYQYDENGWLRSVHDRVLEKTIRYEHDRSGRRTSIALFSGLDNDIRKIEELRYAYDAAGNLSQIVLGKEKVVSIMYDALGRQRSIRRPNGIGTTIQYDEAGRKSAIRVSNEADETQELYSYQYSPAGLMLSMEIQEANATVEHIEFKYDDGMRLIREARAKEGALLYEYNYEYDSRNNRVQKENGTETITYRYDEANRLREMVKTQKLDQNKMERTAFDYDRNGNLIATRSFHDAEETPFREERQIFDPLGRLRYWTDGQCFERTVYRGVEWHRQSLEIGAIGDDPAKDKLTAFLYDGDNVLLDINASENTPGLNPSRIYVTAGLDQNLLLHQISTRENYWYGTDALGSIRSLTNAKGRTVNRYDYTAFGEKWTEKGLAASAKFEEIPQRYGFTAREEMPFSDQMHYRFRQYKPGTGRFVSRDPLVYGASPDLNLYAYALNQPQMHSDPYGLGFLCWLLGLNCGDDEEVAPVVGSAIAAGAEDMIKVPTLTAVNGLTCLAGGLTAAGKTNQELKYEMEGCPDNPDTPKCKELKANIDRFTAGVDIVKEW